MQKLGNQLHNGDAQEPHPQPSHKSRHNPLCPWPCTRQQPGDQLHHGAATLWGTIATASDDPPHPPKHTRTSFCIPAPSPGNNLDNNCIVELLLILGDPKAPRITQLDLAVNTTLSWQCTRALSVALGARPASDDSGSQANAPELKVGCEEGAAFDQVDNLSAVLPGCYLLTTFAGQGSVENLSAAHVLCY
eukprot:scaffold171061_cov19-Tisochrysis_lutea.AAC.1